MPGVVVPAVTGAFTEYLQPRWHRVLVEVGSDIEELYAGLANVDSDIAWSPLQEAQVSGLGRLKAKPEGTPFPMDNIIKGGSVTYTTTPLGNGFEWTREMMRFDLFGLFDDTSADLVRAAPDAVEVAFWSMVEDGFDGLLNVGFDGLPLFHTAHPSLDPLLPAISNMSSTHVAFSQAGLQVAMLHFNTMVDMRGLRNKRRPALVLIHPLRIPAAREILGSEYVPYSANNELNSITDDRMKYFVVPYFIASAPWYVFARPATSTPMGANVGHDLWIRWAIPQLPDQFYDPRTGSSVQTIYENFGVGFGSFFGAWGSRGTGL